MLNLSAVVEQHTRRRPDAEALVCGEKRLTYAQLNAWANQIANALAASGIRRGDHVALLCPNLPYFPAVYFAILKAGATVVPLNVLLKPREIAYHLRDSDAKAMATFVARQKPGFSIVRDAGQKLVQAVAPPTMPTSFVIDAKGIVRAVHHGFHGEKTQREYVEQITRLLEERS